MEWFLKAVRDNYANFNGRAGVKEYWMFVLFYFIFYIAASILDTVIGTGFVISALYSLALLVPSLAAAVRRLHDTGKSGLWILVGFIPIIGFIWLIILLIKEGDPGPNMYGPPPAPQATPPPTSTGGNPIS